VQLALDPAYTSVVASGADVTGSSFTVSSSLVPNTKYYWRTRAKDVCGTTAYVAASFTTANVCSSTVATYNANYKAPYCASGCGCETGNLVRGRGTIAGGTEANRPNTLGGTCADGNAGAYHNDESVDKLVLNASNRSTIVPGSAVKLDATVWCQSATDRVDLFYATDAANPSWTPLVTGLACTGSGAKVFSTNFNVGANAGAHAVRAQIRYGGLANTCASGSYNDRDDLVFTVAAPFAQTASSPKTLGRVGLTR